MKLVEVRRVSSEEQAGDDRAGLDRQAGANRATAERHGAQLIEPPFVLTDVSRTSFKATPEWKRIVELIADPNVHLVVDTLDRLAAGLEGMALLQACKDTGTRIYTSSTVIDLSTTAGRWVAVAMSMTAGDELESIRYRVQASKEEKRRQGIFPSFDKALPTGISYTRTKGQKAGHWGYTPEIKRVQEVFRLLVREGVTNYSEIGRRTGFSTMTTHNVLRNPIYKGLWVVDEKRQPGPTPIKPDGRRRDRRKIARAPDEVIRVEVFRPRGARPVKGDVREEAAVTVDEWEAAQEIAARKADTWAKPRDPREDSRFTYTGHLWCIGCQAPLWGKTRRSEKGDGRRDYYVCKMAQLTGARCTATGYLSRQKVNDGLDHLFAHVLTDKRLLRSLIQAGLDVDKGEDAERREALEREREKLTAQRRKLLDLYLDDAFDRAELDAKRAALDKALQVVEKGLAELSAREARANADKALEGLRDALVALAEFEFWSTSQKRDVLRRFFPRIEVSREGVESVQVRAGEELLTLRVTLPFSTMSTPTRASCDRGDRSGRC